MTSPASFPSLSHIRPPLPPQEPQTQSPPPSSLPLNTPGHVETIEKVVRGDQQGYLPASNPYEAPHSPAALLSCRTPPQQVSESSTSNSQPHCMNREEPEDIIDTKAKELKNFSQEILNPHADMSSLANRLSDYLEHVNLFNLSQRLTSPANNKILKQSIFTDMETKELFAHFGDLKRFPKLQLNRFLDVLIRDKISGLYTFNWQSGERVDTCFAEIGIHTHYYLTTKRIDRDTVPMFFLSRPKGKKTLPSIPFWIAISALYQFQRRTGCRHELLEPFLDSLLVHAHDAHADKGLKEPQQIEIRGFPSFKKPLKEAFTIESFIEKYLNEEACNLPSEPMQIEEPSPQTRTSQTSTTSTTSQPNPSMQSRNLFAQPSRPSFHPVGLNAQRPFDAWPRVPGHSKQPNYSYDGFVPPYPPNQTHPYIYPRPTYPTPKPPFTQQVQSAQVPPAVQPTQTKKTFYTQYSERLGADKYRQIEEQFVNLANIIKTNWWDNAARNATLVEAMKASKGCGRFDYNTWPNPEEMFTHVLAFLKNSESREEKLFKANICSVWFRTFLRYEVDQPSPNQISNLYTRLLEPNTSIEDLAAFCKHAIEIPRNSLMAGKTLISDEVSNKIAQTLVDFKRESFGAWSKKALVLVHKISSQIDPEKEFRYSLIVNSKQNENTHLEIMDIVFDAQGEYKNVAAHSHSGKSLADLKVYIPDLTLNDETKRLEVIMPEAKFETFKQECKSKNPAPSILIRSLKTPRPAPAPVFAPTAAELERLAKRRADKQPDDEQENVGLRKPEKRKKVSSQTVGVSRNNQNLSLERLNRVNSSENVVHLGFNQQAFEESVLQGLKNLGLDALATKMAKIQAPVTLENACGLNPLLHEYQQKEVQELLAANNAKVSRMLMTSEGTEKETYFEFLMQLLMQGSKGTFAIVAPKDVADDAVPELKKYLTESLFTAWKVFVQKGGAFSDVETKIEQLFDSKNTPIEVQNIHLGLLLYSLLPAENGITDEDLIEFQAKHGVIIKDLVENHLHALSGSEKQDDVQLNVIKILDHFVDNPAITEETRTAFKLARESYQVTKGNFNGFTSLIDPQSSLPKKVLMSFWASLLAYHPQRPGLADFAKYSVDGLKPLLLLSAESIAKATLKEEFTRVLRAPVPPQFLVTSFENLRTAKESVKLWKAATSKLIARIVVDEAYHLNNVQSGTTKAFDSWVSDLRTKFSKNPSLSGTKNSPVPLTIVTEASTKKELAGLFELLKRSLNVKNPLLGDATYNEVKGTFDSTVKDLCAASVAELKQAKNQSNSPKGIQRSELAVKLCTSFVNSYTLKKTFQGLFSHVQNTVESNLVQDKVQMNLSSDVLEKLKDVFNNYKMTKSEWKKKQRETREKIPKVTQLNLHHTVMKILLHSDLACAKNFNLEDPDVQAVLNKFITADLPEKKAFIESSPLLKAVLSCDKVKDVFKKGLKAVFATEHAATTRFFQEALKYQFGVKDEQFKKYEGSEVEKLKTIEWFNEKTTGKPSRHLFLMKNAGTAGLKLSEADVLVQLGSCYSSSTLKQLEKRIESVGNKQKKSIITPIAKTFLFTQQKAIRRVKDRFVNFYQTPSSDVNENFKLYRESVLAECYHKFLNDFKDKNTAKIHLAYVKKVFDEVHGAFLTPELIEKCLAKIQPKVIVAAPAEPVLPEPPEPAPEAEIAPAPVPEVEPVPMDVVPPTPDVDRLMYFINAQQSPAEVIADVITTPLAD